MLLVNRRGVEVLGRPTHRTLAEARDALGEPLDLVVVCVPASELVPAVTDALAAGARSLVVITAGLSELGAEGIRVEREVVRLVREAGAVLVGPNCLGVVDTGTSLQLAHDVLPTGSVAVLSQSGNVALDLAALLEARGLGVSRFVSVGNQADLTVVDLLASCLDHRRHPRRGDLRGGPRRRTRVHVRRSSARRGRQVGGAACARALRRGGPQCRLAHRLADQWLPSGRRRVRRGRCSSGRQPDTARRPAPRAARGPADAGATGSGPDRRGRPRRDRRRRAGGRRPGDAGAGRRPPATCCGHGFPAPR